jgi:hypothetical protein
LPKRLALALYVFRQVQDEEALCGINNPPHAELVEARTMLIQIYNRLGIHDWHN